MVLGRMVCMAKLLLVLLLSGIHGYFARWVKDFAATAIGEARNSIVLSMRYLTVLMIGIVILVVVKPF